MGGDDSQKLLPWRGSYSSPGRSKPPAFNEIKTLAQNLCSVRSNQGAAAPSRQGSTILMRLPFGDLFPMCFEVGECRLKTLGQQRAC